MMLTKSLPMSIFYFYCFHVNYILSGLQIILDVFLALSPILSVFNLVVKFLCENSFLLSINNSSKMHSQALNA
jgi:cellulose synthase/poly-beta-1,6-N-acetylglucosamine synthase-like glycosyltransferase